MVRKIIADVTELASLAAFVSLIALVARGAGAGFGHNAQPTSPSKGSSKSGSHDGNAEAGSS